MEDRALIFSIKRKASESFKSSNNSLKQYESLERIQNGEAKYGSISSRIETQLMQPNQINPVNRRASLLLATGNAHRASLLLEKKNNPHSLAESPSICKPHPTKYSPPPSFENIYLSEDEGSEINQSDFYDQLLVDLDKDALNLLNHDQLEKFRKTISFNTKEFAKENASKFSDLFKSMEDELDKDIQLVDSVHMIPVSMNGSKETEDFDNSNITARQTVAKLNTKTARNLSKANKYLEF